MDTLIERTQQDRREHSLVKIDSLVKTRSTMWADYCDLAGLRPYQAGPNLDHRIHQFCQCLIDYTATAHFQLYHRLTEGNEQRSSVLALADRLFPQIARSTDVILAFNDVFGEGHGISPATLEQGLSELGEVLAERFELEDQVLEAARYDRRSVEN